MLIRWLDGYAFRACKKKYHWLSFSSAQLLSRVWLCHPVDCSMPGFPVHHHLPELAQTHVHQWCPPTISSSVVPFSSCLQSSPATRSFPDESVLCIRWPKSLSNIDSIWFSSHISMFCSKSFGQKHWWPIACLLVISTDFFGAGKASSQKIMSYEGRKEMVVQEICF